MRFSRNKLNVLKIGQEVHQILTPFRICDQ